MADAAAVLDAHLGVAGANLIYANVDKRPYTDMYWQESRLLIRCVGLSGGGRGATDKDTDERQQKRLRAIMRTRCDVTAAAMRHALHVAAGGAASGNDDARWVETAESVESGVCQVDYDGGEHWITYVPESGHVYHSWLGRFLPRRNVVSPGPMCRAKAMEIAVSLDFAHMLQIVDPYEGCAVTIYTHSSDGHEHDAAVAGEMPV